MLYDVILIGSGPANLFAAMELVNSGDFKVLVLEKARRLNDSRNVSNGWLGGCARAGTDLFLEPGFGGKIEDKSVINTFVERLSEYCDVRQKVSKSKILKKTVKRMEDDGISLQEPDSIRLSEDKIIKLGDFFYSQLREKATVLHKTDIYAIEKDDSHFIVRSNQGCFEAKNIVLGAGRGGAKWLEGIKAFDLTYSQSAFDFGVRLEFPSLHLAEILDKTNAFRVKFGDYKTSAVVVHGSVETEEINHIKVANGRQSSLGRSYLCNMSFLKTYKSKDAYSEVYRLAEIVNILYDGQIFRESIQRVLSESCAVSPLEEFKSIREGLQELVRIFPKLSTKCIVYGPEVRLNAAEFNLSASFESDVKGLYIVGDMSGKTNSFVQAACSGLLAAENLKKTRKENEENSATNA